MLQDLHDWDDREYGYANIYLRLLLEYGCHLWAG